MDSINPKILDALDLEQRFFNAICDSEEHGVWFDIDHAEEVWYEICTKLEEIEAKVLPQLPDMPIPKSRLKYPPKVRFKKDGTPSANAIKYFSGKLLQREPGRWYVRRQIEIGTEEIELSVADEPLVTHEKPTLGNQAFIKDLLMDEYGWKPTIWNFKKDSTGKKMRVNGQYVKTSPRFNDPITKILCTNLEQLGEKVEFVKDIITWLTLRHRKNFLKSDNGTGLLVHPRLSSDHRLPAGMDTLGANTGRVQHRVVANVPAVGKLYGQELRACFGVPDNKVMIGWDAAALEDRVKGNRTYKYDGGEYANKILDPDYDPHTENAGLWDCSRNDAKSPYYALVYNCTEGTFTKTLGCSSQEGKAYYEAFWEANSALRDFNKAVEKFYDSKGYLIGLDRRKLHVRSKHSLSNLIFQSDGSILMKRAVLIMLDKLTKAGYNSSKVAMIIFYHDEVELESDPDIAEEVLELCYQSMREAGEYYNCKVEFEATGKIGKNWSEVH